MQSYYEKYLKYKNKYTTLKNQKGGLMGGSSEETLAKNLVTYKDVINTIKNLFIADESKNYVINNIIDFNKFIENMYTSAQVSFKRLSNIMSNNTFFIELNLELLYCRYLSNLINNKSDAYDIMTIININKPKNINVTKETILTFIETKIKENSKFDILTNALNAIKTGLNNCKILVDINR